MEVGDEGSRQHGYFYFTEDQYVLSPWHDVPLYPIERVLQPDKAASTNMEKETKEIEEGERRGIYIC